MTDLAAALMRLDEITRRLRRECPWDREQDERSIVPHTVEEAYELADAAHSATTPSCWTSSATCSSRSTSWPFCWRSAAQGDLAAVADHCREKLIRRHPHVFGEREADDRRRRGPQLERDQARGGARRRDLRPHPRDAALDPLREEGAEAGGERRASRWDAAGDDPGERLLGGGAGGRRRGRRSRARAAGGRRTVSGNEVEEEG